MKILIAPVHHFMDNYTGSEYTRVYEILDFLSKDSNLSGDAIVGYSNLKSMGQIKIHNLFNQKPDHVNSLGRFIFPFQVLLKAALLMTRNKYDRIWHMGPFAINKTFSLLAILNNKKIPFILGPIYTPLYDKQEKHTALINDRDAGRNINTPIWRKLDHIVYQNFSNVFSYFSKLTLKSASKIVVFEKAGNKLLKQNGINNGQVIHLGVAHQKFYTKPRKSFKKVVRLLTVSYLIERKRVVDIITAIYHLVNEYEVKNISLTIVGDGPMWDTIKSLINKLELKNYIKLTGQIPRTKIHTYYKNSDLFITGSVLDTMPAMYFEAMSAALPMVIATNDSALELKEDGFGGFVIPGKNPKAMSKAILKIINDKKLYETMSYKNYQLSRTSYNFEKAIQELKKTVYDK